MAKRHLPVRPDLEQLKHQAKDLLRAARAGDAAALAEVGADAKLADAQRALARSYGVASWPRLSVACRLIDAIWRDDVDAVRALVTKQPVLMHENARGTEHCNWGPPMSYAANWGRDRIIAMLRELGARDLQKAFDRACLQGRIETARALFAMGARPAPDALMGPCETHKASGLAFLFELGAPPTDEHGDRLAPVAMVLQTYARHTEGKHGCLALLAEHGVEFPDTAPMAVHRGRVDLLESLVRRDRTLLDRPFAHEDIYPPSLGCSRDHTLALHGTPLAGGTLLHLCADNDEVDLARCLLEQGANANAPAAIDADGFGGHTALYGCVVSQPFRNGNKSTSMARLLLEHGARTDVRANVRKRLRFVDDETMHEYRDVTPLAWGRAFHDQAWVNPAVLELLG